MPLHLSWAAMANYCQHETESTTKHFGHHAHQHQAKVDKSDQGKATSLGMVDADCGFCHACCAAIVSGVQDVPSSGILSISFTQHHDGPISTFPSRPERPNWATIA